MNIRLKIVATCLLALIPLVITTPAMSAGSGGGGGVSGGGVAPSRASLSPEQASARSFRAGIKHRDRALKQERKAAKATKEKARTKALAKAQKEYKKAITKQGAALRHFAQNYKAANELGYALRKTGDYRKAIGAYNYALKINPNFHRAIEYRGEAFLALGFLDQTKQSYMVLFRNDRELADQLMATFDTWLETKGEALTESETEFAGWIEGRKRMASITNDLSSNNTRTW